MDFSHLHNYVVNDKAKKNQPLPNCVPIAHVYVTSHIWHDRTKY